MLRGVTNLNLDQKGRMAIPSRYRPFLTDACDGHLVVTVDKGQCLLVYPLPEWEEIERKLVKLPSFNKQARLLQRLLIGHATEVDMDGNGRVLVPPALRKYAGMDKEIVLIGQGNKFELWDEQVWNAKCVEWLDDDSFDSGLPEQLESFSL